MTPTNNPWSKKDANRNQAKLLEVEAHNTKLIRESLAQQQRTQEKHELEMQITRERYAEERADHKRQLQITEEQRRAYNLQQE